MGLDINLRTVLHCARGRVEIQGADLWILDDQYSGRLWNPVLVRFGALGTTHDTGNGGGAVSGKLQ